jgi:hypothetical protein
MSLRELGALNLEDALAYLDSPGRAEASKARAGGRPLAWPARDKGDVPDAGGVAACTRRAGKSLCGRARGCPSCCGGCLDESGRRWDSCSLRRIAGGCVPLDRWSRRFGKVRKVRLLWFDRLGPRSEVSLGRRGRKGWLLCFDRLSCSWQREPVPVPRHP